MVQLISNRIPLVPKSNFLENFASYFKLEKNFEHTVFVLLYKMILSYNSLSIACVFSSLNKWRMAF